MRIEAHSFLARVDRPFATAAGEPRATGLETIEASVPEERGVVARPRLDHPEGERAPAAAAATAQTRRWITEHLPGASVQATNSTADAARLLAAGGDEHEVFDPATETWTTLLSELPFDTRHARMLAYRDRLLIVSTHRDDGRMLVALVRP